MPRPDWIKEGHFPGIHDPQWWIGKTAAETKAGPLADEYDVRRAAATLKGMQTKKGRKKEMTSREEEMEWKLKEGLRRQKVGLTMSDEEDEESLESGEEDQGDDEDAEEEEETFEDLSVLASRKRKRPVIAESDDEDQEEHVSAPAPRRRRRPVIEDSEDEE